MAKDPIRQTIARINVTPIRNLLDADRLLVFADYALGDKQRNSRLIGAAIYHIILQKPFISLQYIERRLRALESNTFLIAAPKKDAPQGSIVRSMAGSESIKNFLWICINGENERKKVLLRYGMTAEENLEKLLNDTGFLFNDPQVVQKTVVERPLKNPVQAGAS